MILPASAVSAIVNPSLQTFRCVNVTFVIPCSENSWLDMENIYPQGVAALRRINSSERRYGWGLGLVRLAEYSPSLQHSGLVEFI